MTPDLILLKIQVIINSYKKKISRLVRHHIGMAFAKIMDRQSVLFGSKHLNRDETGPAFVNSKMVKENADKAKTDISTPDTVSPMR